MNIVVNPLEKTLLGGLNLNKLRLAKAELLGGVNGFVLVCDEICMNKYNSKNGTDCVDPLHVNLNPTEV